MNDKFSLYKDSYDTPDFVFDYTSAFDYSSIHHMTALKKPEKFQTIFSYKKQQVVIDLADCEPEPWQSTVIRNIITFFCYLFLVFTFPITCWVCIKRVPSLERLAVFRLGKLQPVQGPGLVLVFPVIDSYMKVDLKPKVFAIPPREVLTGDGAILEVSAELRCQVVHSVRYVTRVKEVDATVEALGKQALTGVLGSGEQDDLENHKEALEATLLTKLNETILPWGLEVIGVEIKVMKVLKPAEPTNPLAPVVSALKKALGFSSSNKKPPMTVAPVPMGPGVLHAVSAAPSEPQFEQLINVLHQLALYTAKQKQFEDAEARYRINIHSVDKSQTVTAYLSFKNGEVELLREDKGEKAPAEPDVTLGLSADDLTLILCGRESPMQIYVQGRIQFSGDWSCLKRFMTVIQECTV
ncbi:stomatin-like protein 1 [Ornithodoros turicata]|uniref:Putative prohibitins and stomatins of the pid superfamily protein n=1 Tax=Ornithodoros turicata TaxID=34597 RepID=A0A2R5LMB5_9ACAR